MMKRFALSMRKWPLFYRFLCVILSFVILESLVIFVNLTHGGDRGIATILLLSGILAAWLLKPIKAFAIDICFLVCFITIHILLNGYSFVVPYAISIGVVTDLLAVWCFVTLIKAMDAIRELSQVKEQFLANINHEMRTPLMGVMGHLELLEETDASEEQRELLRHANYCGKELERLINNILCAAPVDVPPPHIQTFQLRQAVHDGLNCINVLGCQVHIDVDLDIIVSADRAQVCQVVRNLVSNAIKYAGEKPVLVSGWKRESGEAVVCIQDRGPGIPAELLPSLFQKFSRLAYADGPARGIGLGLYICKRFVENMRGRIWVESSGVEGEGSAFCFTLPCAL